MSGLWNHLNKPGRGMAEWLAIFFIKFEHKGGCQFLDFTTHHWFFFAALRDSVTVLSSTGRSIQEELKPEIDGK
jgi:hypothetical protein